MADLFIVTVTTTSCVSTLQRPIYRTTTLGYPCYACMWEPVESEYLTVHTVLPLPLPTLILSC